MTDVVLAGTVMKDETLQVQAAEPLLLSLWPLVARKEVTCTFPCYQPEVHELSRKKKRMKVVVCRWEV